MAAGVLPESISSCACCRILAWESPVGAGVVSTSATGAGGAGVVLGGDAKASPSNFRTTVLAADWRLLVRLVLASEPVMLTLEEASHLVFVLRSRSSMANET